MTTSELISFNFLALFPFVIDVIQFKKHAGIYSLTVQQQVPIGITQAWDFFSSPKNLEKITPSHMGFKITSGEPEKMYPGQIISYKVAPIRGITTHWVTEITHVKENAFFVDEQRFGPYRMWHHEHHFVENEKGILTTDIVSYKLPFGFIGGLAQRLFVKNQLTKIFEYRFKKLEELFGEISA